MKKVIHVLLVFAIASQGCTSIHRVNHDGPEEAYEEINVKAEDKEFSIA